MTTELKTEPSTEPSWLTPPVGVKEGLACPACGCLTAPSDASCYTCGMLLAPVDAPPAIQVTTPKNWSEAALMTPDEMDAFLLRHASLINALETAVVEFEIYRNMFPTEGPHRKAAREEVYAALALAKGA